MIRHAHRIPADWLALALLASLLGVSCGSEPPPRPQPAAPEAVKKEPVPSQIPAPSFRPRFAVQVGAFANRAGAEALAAQLSRQYHADALVAPAEVGGRTLYRVRVLVEKKADAEALAAALQRNQKLKAWIVPLP